MAKIRACVYDYASPSGVKMIELSPPKRSSKTALIRVRACGVNPVDAKYVIGDKLPESWMQWAARRATGHTPGFDFSGTVVEIAAGNPYGLVAGDEVFGFASNPIHFFKHKLHGSFGEMIAAPLDQIAKKPSALTHVEAAAVPLVGTTALQAFMQHGIGSRAGQRLLIVGASGGVGHIAVQVARHLGCVVTAVCSGRNASFVEKECGAHAVLAYDDGDVYAAIAADAAAHGAYDFVLDCVSSADARDVAASYAARLRAMSPPVIGRGKDFDGHNYVVLGGATRHWAKAGLKRFTSLNTFQSGFELFWIKMPGSVGVLKRLAAFADAAPVTSTEGSAAAEETAVLRPLRPKVETRLDFSEAGARTAFDTLRGRRTAGKIVMEMRPPPGAQPTQVAVDVNDE